VSDIKSPNIFNQTASGEIKTNGMADSAFVLFVRQSWMHLSETISTQSYYAAGLVLQKGLPYLLIPLLVRLYGAHTYSNYVLFYTSTLMFAQVIALSVPNAIIPFWYAEKDKSRVAWTFIVTLALSQLLVGLILVYPASLMYGHSFGSKQRSMFTLAALSFAVIFNFNAFLTGVCRALNSSKAYLAAQILAAVSLIAGVLLLSRWASVGVLIGVFLLSLTTQNIYLSKPLLAYLRKPSFDRRIARSVLAYSLPMLPHLVSVLFCYWVDKYLVRQYFSGSEFTRFTITFQYAFIQAFFAQVFAMHMFPIICHLVAEGNDVKLHCIIRAYNLLLICLGAGWIGCVLLLQALGVPLRIDPLGFVFMGLAFLTWNLAGNYINTLWARFRTGSVTGIMLSAMVVLVATLGIGCAFNWLLICYSAQLLAAIAALAALVLLESSYVRRVQPQSLQAVQLDPRV